MLFNRVVLSLALLAGLFVVVATASDTVNGGAIGTGLWYLACIFALLALVGLALMEEVSTLRKATRKHHEKVEGHLQAIGTLLQAVLEESRKPAAPVSMPSDTSATPPNAPPADSGKPPSVDPARGSGLLLRPPGSTPMAEQTDTTDPAEPVRWDGITMRPSASEPRIEECSHAATPAGEVPEGGS